jgi:hypothetical protein
LGNESTFGDNIYVFGYQFKDNVDSKTRTEFIRYLKRIDVDGIPEQELQRFVRKPLNYLYGKIRLATIDVFVYPISQATKMNQILIRAIGDYIQHDIGKPYE